MGEQARFADCWLWLFLFDVRRRIGMEGIVILGDVGDLGWVVALKWYKPVASFLLDLNQQVSSSARLAWTLGTADA